MLPHLSLLRALTASVGLLGFVQTQDVPHFRTYFYVGGSYIEDASGQHYLHQQMYVEKLVPLAGVTQPYPIVFIHGWLQTATVGVACSIIPCERAPDNLCRTFSTNPMAVAAGLRCSSSRDTKFISRISQCVADRDGRTPMAWCSH